MDPGFCVGHLFALMPEFSLAAGCPFRERSITIGIIFPLTIWIFLRYFFLIEFFPGLVRIRGGEGISTPK